MDTQLFAEILRVYRRDFGRGTAIPRARGYLLSEADQEFWEWLLEHYGEQTGAEFEAWMAGLMD